MALNTTPTYSTLLEFQARTPVASQKTILSAVWLPFALRAEEIIDSYVDIAINQKFDSSQSLKFPIKDDDGNSWIPKDITLACIEITSDLILKGDPTAQTGFVATSENWSGDGYSFTNQKKSNSSIDDLKIDMPALALRLLLPWKTKTARLKY